MLDNVEVNTVQGLMEYLYRGECKIKDRKGFQEMRELVNMLGLTLKLEIPRGNIDLSEVDISADNVNKLKREQKLNNENAKFNDLLSQG